MSSVELIIPSTVSSSVGENVLNDTLLSPLRTEFGGYSEKPARQYARDNQNRLQEVAVTVYEVAVGNSLDALGQIARAFAAKAGCRIEARIDGESAFYEEGGRIVVEAEPAKVSDWPETFDIAVQTVIGPELHAVQDHFGYSKGDHRSVSGTRYYRGRVEQPGGTVSVVVCCQGVAGNDAAALIAERLISQWSPKAIFLVGISAGRRGKCKIGDVVTPRVIVDDTEGVAEAKARLKRTQIFPPPHAMIQQLMDFRLDECRDEWVERLMSKRIAPAPPAGSEVEYSEHVAAEPSHIDAAIYSSDTLLRDPEILERESIETHQQIKIGEMEAAGFGHACNQRDVPTPWFVVRGVSDFGDEFKSDGFHGWAAHTAASYLYTLIRHGISCDQL